MMTFLVTGLLMAAAAQAQTSRNCADSNAEVAACPENYLPKVVVPTAGSKQSVINAIAKVTLAAADEDKAYRDLENLKLLAKGDPQDGDYVKQLQVVQNATKVKYDLANDAIRLAAVVYHLTPPVPDFTGDPRASVLTTVKPWLPRYSEREKYDENLGRYRRRTKLELDAEAAKSQSAIGGAGSVAAAQTWAKGEIAMFIQAFDDPDDLAVLIYHETSHWVDVAAKPGGGRESDLPRVTFISEADAYARSAKIAQQLGRDPTQMLAMAARFELQAKEAGSRSWEWVIINRRNWLGTERRGPLAMVPAGPEAASDDETTLHQKMAELQAQVKKNREYAEQRERERLEDDARNREMARQYELEKEQAFRAEMDAEAAACGYRIHYDEDNKTMLGFNGYTERYRLGRNYAPFDFGDLKVVFLMSRVCYEIEGHPEAPAPPACNGAVSLLHERVGRGDFVPKLKYLAMYPITGSSYVDSSECLQELLTNSDKITDAKSFNKITSSFQKRLAKRRAEEAKRDRKRKESGRDENPGRGSPPPDGNDHFWDPGCQCWVRRY